MLTKLFVIVWYIIFCAKQIMLWLHFGDVHLAFVYDYMLLGGKSETKYRLYHLEYIANFWDILSSAMVSNMIWCLDSYYFMILSVIVIMSVLVLQIKLWNHRLPAKWYTFYIGFIYPIITPNQYFAAPLYDGIPIFDDEIKIN